MSEVKKVVLAYSGGLDTNSSPELASFSTARKVYKLCFRISSRCATNNSRQG